MSGTDTLYVLLVWDTFTDGRHVHTTHSMEDHEGRKSLFASPRYVISENIYQLGGTAKKVVKKVIVRDLP